MCKLGAARTHARTHTQHTTILQLSGLSGTTRVSWYQKVYFAIFWIFCCKMKITQADTPWTATPSRLIDAPIAATPTIFMSDVLPYTTLPIYPGLEQAPNMLTCIPAQWLGV